MLPQKSRINNGSTQRGVFIKFAGLNLLFFGCTLNYGIFRALKDSVFIGSGGSALLSFLKLIVPIPMILCNVIYSWMCKKFDLHRRLLILLSYFGGFFLLYTVLLQHYTTSMSEETARSLNNLQIAWRLWPDTLFYFHSEAWGNFIVSIGFWTVANSLSTREQAKKYYTQLSIGAAVATFCAGLLTILLSNKKNLLLGLSLVIIVAMLAFYLFFSAAIDSSQKYYQLPKSVRKKKKKKLGIVESLKELFTSPDSFILLLISMLVLGYGISILLYELAYKESIKRYFYDIIRPNNPAAVFDPYYRKMMGKQLCGIGIVSLLIVLILARLIRKEGWCFTALVVPILLLTGALLFFGRLGWCSFKNETPPWAAMVAGGMLVLVLVKSSKYVCFDSTKEEAFLVLDEQSKLTGKSAIDAVVSRLGKAGGSVIFWTLQLIVPIVFDYKEKPSPLDLKWWLAGLIILLISGWLWAVIRLDRERQKRLQKLKDND